MCKKSGSAIGRPAIVAVEAAHENNANVLQPAIETAKRRGPAPEKLRAETLYGSDGNCRKAREEGGEQIAPAGSGKPVKGVALADIIFSARGKVVSCPRGHLPIKTKDKEERHSAAFEAETIAGCPLLKDSQIKPGKRGHSLRYTDKEVRLAKRSAHEMTSTFCDKYRVRVGVEATMS